jgi:chromatin remodeling complex protein RSC6
MTAVGYNHTNALKMSSSVSVSKTNKMPADKKTAKKTESTPAAPVVATASAPAPTPAKKTAAPKKTAAKSEVVVPTVSAPAVPAVVSAAAPTQNSEAMLTELTEKLRALSTEFSTKVREAVRSAQEAIKQTKREHRNSKKKVRKNPEEMTAEERKAWEARRANNAFLVQRPLTPELCSFMGIAAGSKRSQTEVTKFVSEYVKSHNCFDPNFKRRILPNAALAKLLKVDDKTEVTYLNLQKYLKVHFLKATA